MSDDAPTDTRQQRPRLTGPAESAGPVPAGHEELPDQERTPIAEASRILGVPMPTLRSWELRYGIPASVRTSGTHRSYSAEDLQALRLMRDEIVRGQRAGLAAQAVRALLGIEGPARELIDALLLASRRRDSDGIREELARGASLLGMAGCIDDVIFPAMKQIGEWWEVGHCDIEQERLTSETVRAWLDSQAARAPAPMVDQPIVLACGPSDQHTIGLEALALLLRYQRRACRLLGARVSPLALVTAVQATQSPAVAIVCHLGSGRQRAIRSLRAVDDLGTPVFFAGNAFTSPRSRRGVPGSYLGTRLQNACAVIVGELPVKSAR